MYYENAGNCFAVLIDKISGEEFNITRFSSSIGRAIGCDIVLNSDKTISRQHALIQFLDGKFFVQDLFSRNGTRLNGKKIQELSQLKSGDEISIGLTQLVFVLVSQNFSPAHAESAVLTVDPSEITSESVQRKLTAGM